MHDAVLKVKLSDLFMSGINSTAARASALGKGRVLRASWIEQMGKMGG